MKNLTQIFNQEVLLLRDEVSHALISNKFKDFTGLHGQLKSLVKTMMDSKFFAQISVYQTGNHFQDILKMKDVGNSKALNSQKINEKDIIIQQDMTKVEIQKENFEKWDQNIHSFEKRDGKLPEQFKDLEETKNQQNLDENLQF